MKKGWEETNKAIAELKSASEMDFIKSNYFAKIRSGGWISKLKCF